MTAREADKAKLQSLSVENSNVIEKLKAFEKDFVVLKNSYDALLTLQKENLSLKNERVTMKAALESLEKNYEELKSSSYSHSNMLQSLQQTSQEQQIASLDAMVRKLTHEQTVERQSHMQTLATLKKQYEQELLQVQSSSSNASDQRATVEIYRAREAEQQRLFEQRLREQEATHRAELLRVRAEAETAVAAATVTTSTTAKLMGQGQPLRKNRVNKSTANVNKSTKVNNAKAAVNRATTKPLTENTSSDSSDIGSIMDPVVPAVTTTSTTTTSSSSTTLAFSSAKAPKRVRFG